MPRPDYTYEGLSSEEMADIAQGNLSRVEARMFELELELDQLPEDHTDREALERLFTEQADRASRVKQSMADRNIPRQKQRPQHDPQLEDKRTTEPRDPVQSPEA